MRFSLTTLVFFALSIFFSGLVSLYYAVDTTVTFYAVVAGLFVCVVSEKLMIRRGQSAPKSKVVKLYGWLLYFVCVFTFVALLLSNGQSDDHLLHQVEAQARAITGAAAVSSLLSIATVVVTSSTGEINLDVAHPD